MRLELLYLRKLPTDLTVILTINVITFVFLKTKPDRVVLFSLDVVFVSSFDF